MSFKKISLSIIRNIKRISNNKLNLHEPFFFGEETKELNKCIKNTYVSSKSKVVSNFEKKISKYTNSKFTVATITGTSALHMCLVVIGVKRNQEIFLPSFNYISAANSIIYCGAIPHFVDINKDDLSVDPTKFERYLQKKFMQITELLNSEHMKTQKKILLILLIFKIKKI